MLDERGKKVLWAVVQTYIGYPDPVGSRVVTKKYAFGLSPATIRNIMSDLEELGYLSQPHTSAGRIPTDKGYRFYVDNLLMGRNPIAEDREVLLQINGRLKDINEDINCLIEDTSRMLSNFSHYLGVATAPRLTETRLRHIELVRHRGRHILVILVSSEGIVKNRIIPLREEIPQKILNKISQYLNEEFTGMTLREIKGKIVKEMSKEKVVFGRLVSQAIRLFREILNTQTDDAYSEDVYIDGLSSVFDMPDFANLSRIKEVFKAIENKYIIVKLLDRLIEFEGVQILIGSENQIEDMHEMSMVISTYKHGGAVLGTIGVLGPKRMDYSRVIPIVDYTAKRITNIISKS